MITGAGQSSGPNYTSPNICVPVQGILTHGIWNRNRKRCAALKFNGWEPDDATLATLDFSSPYLYKGLFDVTNYIYAPVRLHTRAKWGGEESKHKFDEIVTDGYWWYKEGDQHAVKHFKGVSDTLIDVKLYLKMEFQYEKLTINNPYAPWYLNARRPSLSNPWREVPPWSEVNTAITEVMTLFYSGTSEVWVPTQNGIPGHYEPVTDYWQEVTWSYSPTSGQSVETEYIEKPYSTRSAYIAQWHSEGYLPWDTIPDWRQGPLTQDLTNFFKETGMRLSSDQCVYDPYTGYDQGQWYNFPTWGIMCREAESGSYDFPEDAFPLTKMDPTYSWTAWKTNDDTYCYNVSRRKMRIKVYARITDTCHSCYFKDNNYNLSISYQEGSATMKYDPPNGDPYVDLDFNGASNGSEDISVTIPPPSDEFTKDYELHTIDWDPAPGTCRRITDFKLNYIS